MRITREQLIDLKEVVENKHKEHMEALQAFHQAEYKFLAQQYEQWTKDNVPLLADSLQKN